MTQTFTLSQILNTTCDYFNISVEEIKSKTRKGNVNDARKVFYYVSDKFSKSTLKDKANVFGCRKMNAWHHIRDVSIKKEIYPEVNKDIEHVINLLTKD